MKQFSSAPIVYTHSMGLFRATDGKRGDALWIEMARGRVLGEGDACGLGNTSAVRGLSVEIDDPQLGLLPRNPRHGSRD